MSDDLVKQLREDQPVTQDMGSTMQCSLQDAAADRIEELEAKLAKAVEGLKLADKAIMDVVNSLDLAGVASVFNAMSTIRTTLAELNKERSDEKGIIR